MWVFARSTCKDFNNGTLLHVQIFKGPYACEEDAQLDVLTGSSLSGCLTACQSTSGCLFYMFRAAEGVCTLYGSCEYMQQVNLKISNELYGIPSDDTPFCRIADPETCWQEIKRRSYLSLTESELPVCLFQEQHVACDSLQLVSGEVAGSCARCQYLDARSSFASKGMRKLPLPEEFPAASQIVVGCNATSRMFAQLQDGLVWKGPRPKTIFSCVSGSWVGDTADGGAWQSLENLKCEDCLQLGSQSLQRFTNVSMPEVFFMEHRLVQVTHGSETSTSCGMDQCWYGMDMVDTAAQLWNLSVEDPKGHELQLQQWRKNALNGHFFDIHPADFPDLCLTGDFSKVLHGQYPLQISKDCSGNWSATHVSKKGFTLRYFFGKTAYFLQSNSTTGAHLVPAKGFPGGVPGMTWEFERSHHSGGAVFIKDMQVYDKYELYLQDVGRPLGVDMSKSRECTACHCRGLFTKFFWDEGTTYPWDGKPVLFGNYDPKDVGIDIDWTNCSNQSFQSLPGGSPAQVQICGPDTIAAAFPQCKNLGPADLIVTVTCCYVRLSSRKLIPRYSQTKSCGHQLTVTTGNAPPLPWKGKYTQFIASFEITSSFDGYGYKYCVETSWISIHRSPPAGGPQVPTLAPKMESSQQQWRLVSKGQTSLKLNWLRACDVSIEAWNISQDLPQKMQPKQLNLTLQQFDGLSRQQQDAYQTLPAARFFPSDSSGSSLEWKSVFFGCQMKVLASGTSTTCAQQVPMLQADSTHLAGKVSPSLDKTEVDLLTQVSSECPFLKETSEDWPVGTIFSKGWKMSNAFSVLWNQNYVAAPFLSPSEPPFNYTGKYLQEAQLVGFLGLSLSGDSLWGLACPNGAVVVSEPTTLPHCLQINATEEPWRKRLLARPFFFPLLPRAARFSFQPVVCSQLQLSTLAFLWFSVK